MHRSRSAFPSRTALLEYEEALARALQLDDAVAAGDLAAAERCSGYAWQAVSQGAHLSLGWDSRGAARVSSGPAAAPDPNPVVVVGSTAMTAAQPPLFLARFSAAWVCVGMCCVRVSLLERAHK